MDGYQVGHLPLQKTLSTDSLLSKNGASEEAKLKKAAQAFEGYFVYTLLKEMQKTTPKGSMFGKGTGGEVYEHLFQQALADKLSTSQNGIGLTKFLMNELQRRSPSPSAGGEVMRRGENKEGLPIKKNDFIIGNGVNSPTATSGSGLLAPRAVVQPLKEENR